MLNRLYVKNVALISEADIEFDSGLNVLSGETGSGKSAFPLFSLSAGTPPLLIWLGFVLLLVLGIVFLWAVCHETN